MGQSFVVGWKDPCLIITKSRLFIIFYNVYLKKKKYNIANIRVSGLLVLDWKSLLGFHGWGTSVWPLSPTLSH